MAIAVAVAGVAGVPAALAATAAGNDCNGGYGALIVAWVTN